MLEKYMAPWGNKVPWINKVIKLEAEVLALGKRLARALNDYACLNRDYRRLHDSYDGACREINRLKEKEYKRYVQPTMSMLSEGMQAALCVHEQVDIDEMEARFFVRTARRSMATMTGGLKYLVQDLVEHREYAARELANEILKHLEHDLSKKGIIL